MVIRFVTEGDFFLPLLLPELAVSVLMCGGGISHGNSNLTTFQSAAKPDQIVCKSTMPTMVWQGSSLKPLAMAGLQN